MGDEKDEKEPKKPEPIPYPAYRFHEDGRDRVVSGPSEDAELKKEPGWHDSKAEADAAAEKESGPGETSGAAKDTEAAPQKRPTTTTRR